MADTDSNAKPSLGELMNRLYDVQALVQCAAASLDEEDDDCTIRVLRHAESVTQNVIDQLDALDTPSQAVLKIAEQVRRGSAIVQ